MRRTKEDTEKTRQAILIAAEKLFVTQGFSETSLEKIATEAGCTRGAIHWHFVNKNGLLTALKEKQQTPMQELVDYLQTNADADPLEMLQDMTVKIFVRMDKESGRRALLRLMMEHEIKIICKIGGEPGERHYHAIHTRLNKIFHIAEEQKLLNSSWSGDKATLAFMFMVGGLVREWALGDAGYTMSGEGADLVITLLQSMRARESDNR